MPAFSKKELSLASKILARLRRKKVKLVTAESCTGGLLAVLLTEIPGSSDGFDCGVITYSNAAKQKLLGVPAGLLKKHGAVSEEVAKAMAQGALKRLGGKVSISITGIAGPGGGTKAKPVGLVHIAAGKGKKTLHRKLLLAGARSDIRHAAMCEALRLAEKIF